MKAFLGEPRYPAPAKIIVPVKVQKPKTGEPKVQHVPYELFEPHQIFTH